MTLRIGVAVPTGVGLGAGRAMIEELAGTAEELGYDSIWFPDHVAMPDYVVGVLDTAPYLEPVVCCTWALAITSRLKVGTDVLVAAYRHPLVVRAVAGTAARMSGNRFLLGVGVGWLKGEFEALGEHYDDRASRTDELLRVMRFGVDGMLQIDDPVPLLVGGNHPRAIRRAALLGDGWHPLWVDPATYAAARARILSLRAEAGLPESFTFSYSCPIVELRDPTPSGWPAPPAPQALDRPEYGYRPPMIFHDDNRPWFVGSPEEIAADAAAVARAGVDNLVLRFRGDDVPQQMQVVYEALTQAGLTG
jgi:alkanesulfonate monooxygenase SsuD/methylene tetrahydromethanopterin reductase-like flavin-dependent oxidoreductase (luciferase family)